MLNEKIIFLFLLLILVLAGIAGAILNSVEMQKEKIRGNNTAGLIRTFEECAAAGFPIMESYPRQCRTSDGKHFTEEIETPRGETSETPEVPVVDAGGSKDGCVPAGCSGQLCLEEEQADNIMTTCEYKPEYACYRSAVCERQKSGACGWRETEELRICTAEAKGVR